MVELTFGANGAGMSEHDVFGDGKAKASASRFAGAGLIDAVEALEQARQMFGSDARTKVPHVKLDAAVQRASAQHDAIAGSCVLHSVFDEVRKHLVNGFAIGVHGSGDRLLNGEFHTLGDDYVVRALDGVLERSEE